MEKLGVKIKRRRKELKKSQKELASEVGVSHVSISQWESDTNNPKTENFFNLASALNLSIEELLSDVDLSVMDDETFIGIVKASYPRLNADKRKALMDFLLNFEMSR